jgi:hypothetical protein
MFLYFEYPINCLSLLEFTLLLETKTQFMRLGFNSRGAMLLLVNNHGLKSMKIYLKYTKSI